MSFRSSEELRNKLLTEIEFVQMDEQIITINFSASNISPGKYFLKGANIDIDERGMSTIVTNITRQDMSGGAINIYIPATPPEEQVIFSGPATILIAPDGIKTVVKCSKGDKFDPVKGYLLCKFLQSSGKTRTQASKHLKKITESWCVQATKERNIEADAMKAETERINLATTIKTNKMLDKLVENNEISYEFTNEDYED